MNKKARAQRPRAILGTCKGGQGDTCAGPELLDAIAKIRGLEKLASLTQSLHEVDASVHIISPPTLIITLSCATAASK